jgi:hypothetical protein
MAGLIRVDIRDEDMQRAVATLKLKAKPAIARALNRTADSGKTAIVRSIATDLGLKVGVVRDLIVIRKATSDNLAATFHASAKRVPLIDFSARGPEPSRGKGKGVKARLPGGAGVYPHAFIAVVGQGGHRGVFQRKGLAKRLPIVELRGPSIWQSFQKNQQVAVDRVTEQLTKNIAHELSFALSRT